ncbi:AAA family ATPase [Bradyrhizobium sp. SZCCHNPS10062]|nr:AAA family ATPase [Bradyrhizobium sp. SZCCHNPS10062]
MAGKRWVMDQLGVRREFNGAKTKGAKQAGIFYIYEDENGAPYLRVKRTPDKQFIQYHLEDGKWVLGAPKGPKIPYHLDRLIDVANNQIIVAEGEKDTDALWKIGYVATCNPGGAGKWPDELCRWFKGRDIIVMPDNDEPGLKHAALVERKLKPVVHSVRIAKVPAPHKDISDWIAAGATADDIAKLIDGATAPLDDEAPSRLTYFDACGAFVRRPSILKGLLVRSETSAWIGPPKSGKSAFIVDMAVFCASGREWQGHKAKEACGVLILALERADLCKRRLHAYAVRDGLKGLPIAVRGGVVDLMNPACVDLIIQDVREVETHFDCPVGLIIIDTFNKSIAAGGGDEDKARDQNRVAVNLRRVHEQLSVHIALVGHTGKDETRGARGSNAHLGDVDVMVQISGAIIKQAEVTNANDQPERVLAQFKLDPFNLGPDEDGDPIMVSIVSAEEITTAAPKASEPKLTKNEKTMFGILHEAGKAGMSTEQWNNAGRAAGIGHGRRADLHDAQTGLRRKKLAREYQDRWHVNHRQGEEA